MANLTDWNWTYNFDPNQMGIVQAWSNLSDPRDLFYPIHGFWLQELGAWFWFIIYFITISMVYVKTNSIYPTSLVTFILSLVMIITLPPPVQKVAYVFMVLSVSAVMYRLLIGRD